MSDLFNDRLKQIILLLIIFLLAILLMRQLAVFLPGFLGVDGHLRIQQSRIPHRQMPQRDRGRVIDRGVQLQHRAFAGVVHPRQPLRQWQQLLLGTGLILAFNAGLLAGVGAKYATLRAAA